MQWLFGLVLLSFVITSALVVPFIDLLYKLKFRRTRELAKNAKADPDRSVFDKLHKHKIGTPVGGGILVILVTVVLFSILVPTLGADTGPKMVALLMAFLGFGLLGLYDDVHKFFQFKQRGRWGLKMRHKFIIQWVIGLAIGYVIYSGLSYNNVYIAGQNLYLGFVYIFFAAFVIVAFSNAFNITDGLDGLSGGLSIITLVGYLFIASSTLDLTLQIFIGIWLGAMFAFLYFNIHPARIWMGDVGALAFGAALGVISLLTAKPVAMAVVGGVFVIEFLSSGLQILSKKFLRRKLFPIAPFHLWLQMRGWTEPTIVMRLWILGAVFTFFGVWFALVT